MNNDELKWDRNKQDARNLERERERMKGKISRIYTDWKARFLARRKRKIGEVPAMLQELRDLVTSELDKTGLINDVFGQHTLKTIEDKIDDLSALAQAEELLSKQTAFVNVFSRYFPERPDQQPQTPEAHEFRTLEEFMAIPFIHEFTSKEGFVGVVREANRMKALFESGEIVLLGSVSTKVGIEKVPTLQEFRQAINAKNN